MRDPIDELHDFSDFNSGDLPVNPLSASEVRRRGNRLRRRNQALGAVAGVAAVLVIATPFAVSAGRGGDDGSIGPISPPKISDTSTPAPQDVNWLQQVPPDFPLDRNLVAATSGSATGPGLETVCDEVYFPVGDFQLADSRVALSTPESEGASRRTLLLYSDESQAGAAYEAVLAAVAGCAPDGNPEVIEIGSPLAGPSAAYVARFKDSDGVYDGTGELILVHRSGNAVLVAIDSVSGAGDPTVVDDEARRVGEGVAETVGAMCVFTAGGCGPVGSPTGPASGVASDLPLTRTPSITP